VLAKELNREEKGVTILILTLIVGCYNAYQLFIGFDIMVGFPFYPGHSEPIQWYAKDLGFRISIFLLASLMYYLIHDRCNRNYNMLFRATVGFLLKDVIDYCISYDQFAAFWDIITYIGIILYVLFNRIKN
jgi:hypothetical protein